jgi:hypothetical protein
MLYALIFVPGSSRFDIDAEGVASIERTSQLIFTTASKSLIDLVRNFGITLPAQVDLSSDDTLECGHFNASAIWRRRDIKIRWVRSIGSHLLFEQSTRTLYMFNMPSYCRLQIKTGILFQ